MTTTTDLDLAALDAYLERTKDARMEAFGAFLRIPSVSGIPDHAPDVRRAAEWLAGEMRDAGIENVEVAETGGHPAVYGDWLHAGDDAPTVLVYGHYDVQPPDPLEEWELAPFEPLVRDGRMLARGSADDKGQVHLHVRAFDALRATAGRQPVNLRYLFEGEEEASSEHLDAWLEANRDRLMADVAIISDTGFFAGNVPALTISLRGMMYAQIDVEGTPTDLHSGSFGGAVENPANALARIIAGLKEPDGRIAIPGFYDDVVPLSNADRDALAALPFDEEAYRTETGAKALVGERGWTTLERRGARPTLDVNGMWGGFTGDGPKTIIPGRAHAKVSCRLVANQDPNRILELFTAFVHEIAPPGVDVTVQSLGGGRPTLTPIDHPATRAAARALEAAFGQPAVYIREGGSIPVAASLESILGLPVVLLGFANPDEHAHAPNENFLLANYEGGIRTVVRLWHELAALGRDGLD